MTDQQPTQQEFLRAAKEELGLQWDALAELAGISPRALKTYRMPVSSGDYRPMGPTPRRAIELLLELHRSKKS